MFEIARMASPSELIPAFERDIRRIERTEKGTVLNDAVVLERDKQQRKEQQKHEERMPQQKPDSEHPLHVYTSGATEAELDEERRDLNIVA